MPSSYVHPQEAKQHLHNAVDIGKESGSNPIFPFVAVTIDEDLGMQAYGRSQYCVGYSFTSEPIESVSEENTVLLEWDEAKELGMAVGKTSASKDAQVWMDITGGRLTVLYGDESIAGLPGVEPGEGDLEGVRDDLAILGSAGPAPRTFLAVTTEVVKRFTKIRSKSPVMDFYLTGIGNTVLAKIGDHFYGGFEAVDRARVQDPEPMLFN